MEDYRVNARVKGCIVGPGYSGHVKVSAGSYDQAEERARDKIYRNFKDRLGGPYSKDIVIENIEKL